jgi:general secretion pathway protein G
MYRTKEKGFSFIEILVVVTIIGIIATIGLVTYTEFLKQSRDAKRKGDIEQIRAAIEIYKSNNNSYPTIDITNQTDICDDMPACASGVYYLRKVPDDPKNDTYEYVYSSDGSDYTLCALLEQGSTSSYGDCNKTAASEACNYCMGPYGQI